MARFYGKKIIITVTIERHSSVLRKLKRKGMLRNVKYVFVVLR